MSSFMPHHSDVMKLTVKEAEQFFTEMRPENPKMETVRQRTIEQLKKHDNGTVYLSKIKHDTGEFMVFLAEVITSHKSTDLLFMGSHVQAIWGE